MTNTIPNMTNTTTNTKIHQLKYDKHNKHQIHHPKYKKHQLKFKIPNTHLEGIKGRLGLDGDCEAASSTVAVPIRSLTQNSIASKDKCDSTSSADTVLVRKIQHLVKDMVAALREVVAW